MIALRREHPELGTERQCTRCLDWWPEDEEFFYPIRRRPGTFDYFCRACRTEVTTAYRRARAAA